MVRTVVGSAKKVRGRRSIAGADELGGPAKHWGMAQQLQFLVSVYSEATAALAR